MTKDAIPAEIRITFPDPKSSEADIHIEGVNEIQIFGAAELLRMAGIAHMERRAMAEQIEAAKRGGGIIQPSDNIVRELRRQ